MRELLDPDAVKNFTASCAATLQRHEAAVSPFDAWRRGARLDAIASVRSALEKPSVHSSDVSHLSDAVTFNVLLGAASRLSRLRNHVCVDHVELLPQFATLGPCPIPVAVLDGFKKKFSSAVQRGQPLSDWYLMSSSPSASGKPPSRADAVALAKILTFMHKRVDEVYAADSVHPSETVARELLPSTSSSGSMRDAEDSCIMDHLAVVDVGFSEIIRQVKVQCTERGALLNILRETLFGYVGDFLATERHREERIAHKEKLVDETRDLFQRTSDELAVAQRRIVELQNEVRRLETLHKFTIAKHIREKQRMNRKHDSSSGRKAQPQSSGDLESRSDCGSEGSSASDSDELGGTLAEMIRQKRRDEPKARRASMAGPLLVPSQFPHVRDRQRIRAVERVDASMMTEPVLIRSKHDPPPKPAAPAPPADDAPPPMRRRLPSVMLVPKKDVSHNYTQTEDLQSRPPSAKKSPAAPEVQLLDGDSRGRRPSVAVVPPPGGGIVVSTVRAQVAEDIKRRMSLANTRSRATRVNVEVDARPSMSSVGVQKGDAMKCAGTQTSLLLQMHLGGVMQSAATPTQVGIALRAAPSPLQVEALRSSDPPSLQLSPPQPSLSGAVGHHAAVSPLRNRSAVSPSQRSPHEAPLAAQQVSPTQPALFVPSKYHAPPSGPPRSVSPAARPVLSHATQTDLSGPVESAGARGSQGGRGGRLAALVKPLVESDLQSSPSSATAPSTTKSKVAPRVRNVKWVAASCGEIHLSALRDKITSSTDLGALVAKFFRGKFGVEKVADGYVADFIASVRSLVSTAVSDGEPVPPAYGVYAGSSGVAVRMHRRIFATVQFGLLHEAVGLLPDPQFHVYSFQYYLHFLDAFRTKTGPKTFHKEFGDDTGMQMHPSSVLHVCELALKDRFPSALLELYLIAVQNAMDAIEASRANGHCTRPALSIRFPSRHALFHEATSSFANLLPLSDASVGSTDPHTFVAHPSEATWDLDTVLEVLVLSYDTHVKALIAKSKDLYVEEEQTNGADVDD